MNITNNHRYTNYTNGYHAHTHTPTRNLTAKQQFAMPNIKYSLDACAFT